MEPLIINLAPTGMATRADTPHVPLKADEIAADCARCCRAGASILHLHARDQAGQPTDRPEVYRDIILKTRYNCPEAIICVSTTERGAVLDLAGPAKPDMASLPLASINDPAMIRSLADQMRERAIVPELEIFDLDMLDYAKHLIDQKVLREPFYFNLLLGSVALAATPYQLAALVQALPRGAAWAGAGIGRFQFPVNSWAITAGGHVRVGLEDNLYYHAGERLATNLDLVRRLVRVSAACERRIASPAEARARLGLPSLTRGDLAHAA